MFMGHYGVSTGFPRAVRITEEPYTPQRERLCMLWGNPVILRGNPIVIIVAMHPDFWGTIFQS